MNKTRLNQLFTNYIDKFEYINNPDNNETYKWAVVERYRESFNLNAPDLSAMLYEVWKISENLIDSANQQPFYGVICAIATLERIYTKYGYHVLDRTLRLCVGTWEGDIDSLGGNILAGVARLVVAFGDQLRDETFKEKVGFMSVRQLSRIAKERGAGSLGFAEAKPL